MPCMFCRLVLQGEAEGTNHPSVSANFQQTTLLTLLGAREVVRTVHAVGATAFTEMAALYAVGNAVTNGSCLHIQDLIQ